MYETSLQCCHNESAKTTTIIPGRAVYCRAEKRRTTLSESKFLGILEKEKNPF